MQSHDDLKQAILTMCPIVGIEIIDQPPTANVTIRFDKTATIEQKAAALNIVNTFDWNAVSPQQKIINNAIAILNTFVNSTPLNSGDLNFTYDQVLRALCILTHQRVQSLGEIKPPKASPPKQIQSNTIG